MATPLPNRPSATSRSTPESRVRSLEKYVASAHRRLRQARKQELRLTRYVHERELVRAEMHKLSGRLQLQASEAPSRAYVERLLLTYLSNGERLRWAQRTSHVDEERLWETRYTDMSNRSTDFDSPFAVSSLKLLSSGRARNVFNQSVLVPSRGRRDGVRIMSDGGWQSALIVERVDLQRAMRDISPRAAQMLFFRAVADLEFKQVGALFGISPQAAQKAYLKALDELRDSLDGIPTDGRRQKRGQDTSVEMRRRLADLGQREEDLTVVMAERFFWQQRARRMQVLVEELQPRLAQARADAQRIAA